MTARPKRKWPRRILLLLILVFVAIQFVRVERTNPPIVQNVDAPEEIATILRRSCYDCHSYETHWPWYSRVAPVSWLVADDVKHGRGDLNFSDWPTYDFEAQADALDDIHKEVSEGEMPLPIYLVMHPGARLSEKDKATLLAWASAGLGDDDVEAETGDD